MSNRNEKQNSTKVQHPTKQIPSIFSDEYLKHSFYGFYVEPLHLCASTDCVNGNKVSKIFSRKYSDFLVYPITILLLLTHLSVVILKNDNLEQRFVEIH